MVKIFFNDIVGPKYRTGIFSLFEKYYDITWCFGNYSSSIAKIDNSILKKIKRTKTIRLFSNWYWQKGILTSLWKKYDYYILEGELYSLAVWTTLILNKLFFRKKLYLWSHGWYGRESKLKGLLKSLFFSLPTGAFFYGENAKQIMISRGLKTNNIHVIHNSLDYTKQICIRNTSEDKSIYRDYFKNSYPNLIFIGRLTKSKKLDLLINAAYILKEKGLKVNIIFVGEGEAMDEIKELAKKRGILCYFYGACYDETINAKLLASADICVSPGNVGLTAIHSLMFGTPVITHGNYFNQGPEVEAIKEGVTGSFFKENDPESLAQVIEYWLKNSHDTIKYNCFKEVDNFWNPEYQFKVFSSVIPYHE